MSCYHKISYHPKMLIIDINLSIAEAYSRELGKINSREIILIYIVMKISPSGNSGKKYITSNILPNINLTMPAAYSEDLSEIRSWEVSSISYQVSY